MTLKERSKEFALLFSVQFFQYCIVCVSFIALAKGSYAWTFITDMACGINSFFIIQRISSMDRKSHSGMVAYTIGGASGSMLAIYLTKRFMHL